MTRITPTLERIEHYALMELALRDRRDLRDQAVVIVARELERGGLLPSPALRSSDQSCHEPTNGHA